MKRSDRRKIKRLAKETLKNKWYPLREGANGINVADSCSFCLDARSKRKSGYQNACKICYVEVIKPGICEAMGMNDLDDIIVILEQLAKKGKLNE